MNHRHIAASLCTVLSLAASNQSAGATPLLQTPQLFSGTVDLNFQGASQYVDFEFGAYQANACGTFSDPFNPVCTSLVSFSLANGTHQSYSFTQLLAPGYYYEGVDLLGNTVQAGPDPGNLSNGATFYDGILNGGNVFFQTDQTAGPGNFQFLATDPVGVQGQLFVNAAPLSPGAPEMDPASSTIPVALLLATTALIADRRRRTGATAV